MAAPLSTIKTDAISWGQLSLSTSGVLSPFLQPPHLPTPTCVNQMKCSLDSVHPNGQCLLSKTCGKMEHLSSRDSQGGTAPSL